MGAVAYGLDYLAPTTETVAAGSTEVWRIFNLTADTHPIHFHLVNVQVLSRQPFRLISGKFTPTGVARGPEANELGWKETVQMHPGEMTTVIMKFDLPAICRSWCRPARGQAATSMSGTATSSSTRSTT